MNPTHLNSSTLASLKHVETPHAAAGPQGEWVWPHWTGGCAPSQERGAFEDVTLFRQTSLRHDFTLSFALI